MKAGRVALVLLLVAFVAVLIVGRSSEDSTAVASAEDSTAVAEDSFGEASIIDETVIIDPSVPIASVGVGQPIAFTLTDDEALLTDIVGDNPEVLDVFNAQDLGGIVFQAGGTGISPGTAVITFTPIGEGAEKAEPQKVTVTVEAP